LNAKIIKNYELMTKTDLQIFSKKNKKQSHVKFFYLCGVGGFSLFRENLNMGIRLNT